MYFHERETVLPEDTEPLLRLGDKVLFGTYLDEPIEWRVVQLEEKRRGSSACRVYLDNESLQRAGQRLL